MPIVTTEPDYIVFKLGGTATSAELQTAINTAIAAKKALYLVPGSATAATLAAGNLVIDKAQGFKMFATPGTVTLKLAASSNYILGITNSSDVEISGLNFDGSYDPAATKKITVSWGGVYATLSSRIRIEKCRIFSLSASGIFFNACGSTQSGVTEPYGKPAALQNLSGTVSDSEIFKTYSGAGIVALGSPGLCVVNNFIHSLKGNGVEISHQFDRNGEQSTFDGARIEYNQISDIDYVSRDNGPEGNGVVTLLANNVIVANNNIRFCKLSAVRFNSSSQMTCIGNNCYGLGETGIFVEQPDGAQVSGSHPTGTTLVGNTINQCAVGINVTNFLWANAGNRLCIINDNIIRNTDKLGWGISVNGDCTVNGNILECCGAFGILLGTNDNSRDLTATNNLIRNTLYGIGATADSNSGAIFITGNLVHIDSAATNAVVTQVFDPSSPDQVTGGYKKIDNLAEDQTAKAWVKVTNNFRSALTVPVSSSDACDLHITV